MWKSIRILVRLVALGIIAVSLLACGQQGPLYLPSQAAAADRASLPESLLPLLKPQTQQKQQNPVAPD